MRSSLLSRRAPGAGSLSVLAVLVAAPLARSQDAVPGPVPRELGATASEPRVWPGERLDPAQHGPGYVEDMSAVVARQNQQPPGQRLNPKARGDRRGAWRVPGLPLLEAAHSGERYVVNEWGDTRMGIGFPEPVDLRGAWVGGQSRDEAWPAALRAVGYRDGVEVGASPWLEGLTEEWVWWRLDLAGVDRVVVEARPRLPGRAWFKLDDLTFARGGAEVVLGFDDVAPGERLTDTGYGGLVWETGTGDFDGEAVHAPRTPPGVATPGATGSSAADGFQGGGGTTPGLVQSFQGVLRGDAGSFSFPPDTCGAIGPNHFVVVVNRNLGIYDRNTGAQISNVLSTVFLPGSNGDPRVVWDQYTGRWIVLITDFSATATNYLAVSLTSDPTGAWFKTSFFTAGGSDAGCWPDYPTLGVDAQGIYTSSFMVGCSSMTIFALEKAPLVSGAPALGTITAFRNLPFEGAIQPCHTYGPAPAQYFVSVGTVLQLQVRSVRGAITSPTLMDDGLIGVSPIFRAADVPSMGSGIPLDSVDTRLMNAVYRDGSIWTAHTVDVGGRAACRWYELDPATMSVLQQGTVDDPSLHYFFPGIAVNRNHDVVLGFSGSNAGQFAGAYYTGRLSTDAAGQMGPPVQYQTGNASQNNIDGFGRNRWGDYSLSTLDPNDELTLWTVQEYAHATDIWGTRVAEVSFGQPLSYYCTGKTNSVGCVPFVTASGLPSATSTSPFLLTARNAVPTQAGFLLYSFQKANLNFHGGKLCVKAPVSRVLPPKTSKSTGPAPCTGLLDRNFNARIQSGADPLLTVGQTVHAQWFQRDPADPAGFGDSLTDAIRFTIGS